MNQISGEDESWLNCIHSLGLEEFCQKWIPILYNVLPDDDTYRHCCVKLVTRITERSPKTVENWTYNPETVPRDVQKILGLVDAIWKIRQQTLNFFSSLQIPPQF